MPTPSLGVCYYPEHWPQSLWEGDARRMAEIGISYVRIGECAWSRLEPSPGELTFDWLLEALDTLGRHGLKVVLGTPTATLPRWMIDKHQRASTDPARAILVKGGGAAIPAAGVSVARLARAD